MTLEQLIRLAREDHARVINILGTPVIELQEKHAIRRIIINNLVFEKDRIKEKQLDGREKIYLVSPIRLFRSAFHESP
jgi:hypothetical protein